MASPKVHYLRLDYIQSFGLIPFRLAADSMRSKASDYIHGFAVIGLRGCENEKQSVIYIFQTELTTKNRKSKIGLAVFVVLWYNEKRRYRHEKDIHFRLYACTVRVADRV